MRKILLILTVTLLSACAHVGIWNEGYPRDGLGMTSAEKKAEFDRFAIQEVGARGGRDVFEVGRDAEDRPRLVTVSSFYGVLTEVSPGTKAALDELAKLHGHDKWADMAGVAGLVAIAAGPTAAVRNVGGVALLGGAGTGMVLNHLQRDELRRIQQLYNADLMRRIYGAGSPEAARGPAAPL